MDYEFVLPDLGENIDSGDVVSVMVAVGDEIEPNQPVVEIETDKAVVEVPCPQGGRVESIHVGQGDSVSVGNPVLTLSASESNGAASTAVPSAGPYKAKVSTASVTGASKEPRASAPKRPRKKKNSEAPVEEALAPSSIEDDAAPAGPATRRLARELGVDLARVTGSGPGGRITRDDVIQAVRQLNASLDNTSSESRPPTAQAPSTRPTAAAPDSTEADSYGPIRREKMPKIRRTIATNMARSASTIPHVTNFDDADITELDHIRRDSSNEFSHPNVKLTMMAFLMKAVAHSLRLHPMLNASLDMESEEIVYKNYVNLGVAVDTERGLIVPVIREVDALSIPTIAKELMDVAARARQSQFKIEELRGGTFTISNMGAVGGQYSTPIINHPEVAVLLVGRSRKVPVYLGENLVPRLLMPLSLSYDHRLVDGATAARFLNEVINYLQTPGRLLLAT